MPVPVKQKTIWRLPAPPKKRPFAAWAWLMAPLVGLLVLVCTEWVHRGQFTQAVWTSNVLPHLPSYLFSWLLLACLYQTVATLSRCHPAAVLVTAIAGCVPAAITYFKLKLRGEPFFPWDVMQISEAVGVAGQAGLEMTLPMGVSALLFAVLAVLAVLVKEPERRWQSRLAAGLGTALVGAMVVGVFLSPGLSRSIGIVPDMWMQNRYYRNYGVIAGFITNIQNINVKKPAGYNQNTVETLLEEAEKQDLAPEFEGSYAQQGDGQVTWPNIIFVMDESFWDASELEQYGVTFDRALTPNLHRLQQQAAYGKLYSPSFGGGTCDVEFEALTGYSTEFLPSGSKPFQQHVVHPMFSLPSYLKEQGYATQAVHCYYGKFWSRNTAYPNLGIDSFISLEDFVNPEKKRGAEWKGGLVTDREMANKIEELWESRQTDKPLFLHAVTMQNHTSYRPDNYDPEELVQILQAPATMSEKTKGALQDFATGVQQADEMLGQLTDYFSQVEEPVILVFWGDHYNPIGSGYEVYTSTGYVPDATSESPELHQMPLLIWCNYWDQPVELGTLAAYQLSPVLMELFGMEKPAYYEYLLNQLSVYRSRTRGVTIQPDGTATQEMDSQQEQWFENHWLLQYDLMFGKSWGASGYNESSK